jgi:hypothetical protein
VQRRDRLDNETLYQLYVVEQKSLADIARPLGVSRALVGKWLRRAGIPARTVSEGTKLGMRGFVPTEEHRQKLRENIAIARRGITSESHAKQAASMRGRTPPNKGKPMSAAQRALLIAQRADPKYRQQQSERQRGEKSPNWRGGAKPELARQLDRAEWRRVRRLVYERDNWTCQDCGCRCLNTRDSKKHPKRKIQAHHIVSRRHGGTDDLSNLITLCMSCHHRRERAGPKE